MLVAEAWVPDMHVLLPYLIGAASAFVVQFLIQVYVVPRVETQKRREERWVKDVLDLGELLTTSVARSAAEAWEAQQSVLTMRDYTFGPEIDPAAVDRELRARKLTALQANQALSDFSERIIWVADRIIMFRRNTDESVEFFQAAYRYRLQVLKLSPNEYEDLAQDDFDAFWGSERKLRADLTFKVKSLSFLSRPPRASWRRRLRLLRRKIAGRRSKPAPLDGSAGSPPSS
jgi:hypothetical protein